MKNSNLLTAKKEHNKKIELKEPIFNNINQNISNINDSVKINKSEIENINKRADIIKLLNDDLLSEVFIFKSPLNNLIKKENIYKKQFIDDNIEKESNFRNNKLNLEIKLLNKDNLDINFGKKPCNVYNKITSMKKNKREKLFQNLAKHISTFNRFIIKSPYIKLKQEKIFINSEKARLNQNIDNKDINIEYNINNKLGK